MSKPEARVSCSFHPPLSRWRAWTRVFSVPLLHQSQALVEPGLHLVLPGLRLAAEVSKSPKKGHQHTTNFFSVKIQLFRLRLLVFLSADASSSLIESKKQIPIYSKVSKPRSCNPASPVLTHRFKRNWANTPKKRISSGLRTAKRSKELPPLGCSRSGTTPFGPDGAFWGRQSSTSGGGRRLEPSNMPKLD